MFLALRSIFTGILVFLVATLPARGAEDTAGRAVSVEGQVILRHGTSTVPLEVGQPIGQGDDLRSYSKASARILFNDQSILDVGPDSKVQVSHWTGNGPGRKGELLLDFGRVRESVNQKLNNQGESRIRTKTSTFAVRGTDFLVEAVSGSAGSVSSPQSTMTVFQGLVNTVLPSGKQPIPVPVGGRISVNGAGLGKVSLLKAEDLRSLFQRVRIDDTTFAHAVVVGDSSRTRNFGRTTLGTLSGSGKILPVALPASEFKIPGIVLPNANVISSGLQNYYPVQVQVNFQ